MTKEVRKETNLEHYKEELKEIVRFRYDRPLKVADEIRTKLDKDIMYGPGSGNECFTDSILDWMAQTYKEQILDEAEKAYLREVIKPFKDKVLHIYKTEIQNEKNHYIRIVVKSICDGLDEEEIAFPLFKKNTMYKGMEVDKHYTLKELGL